MVTGIAPAERVRDAVRQLAQRRLQPAVEDLGRCSQADVDEVVHDVRKRCKRVRALLRLVRNDLGDEVYRQENRALRDIARALSPIRDAVVVVGVHDDVVREGGRWIAGLRTALVEHHEDLRRRILEGETLPEVRERLATLVARIERWPLATVDWDVLGAGLKRAYGRGRNAMAAAYDDPRIERFHQWRNRAKYLRLQLGYLEELWPEVIGGSAKSAHALTDVLGAEHDRAVLDRAISGAVRAERVDPNREADSLLDFIASRQDLLRARARPIGLRLYAEKPSRFIARLGRYWQAGIRPASAA